MPVNLHIPVEVRMGIHLNSSANPELLLPDLPPLIMSDISE